MDRQLFPLVAPEIRADYGLSLAAIGLLSTIFTLGMAIAGMPTGYLLARFSRKTVLQVGIAIFSAGTMLTIVSTGFSDMLVYRAATGISEAMQLTVLLAIAANVFIHYRAAAFGAVNFSFGIGAIIGPILGSVLVSSYRSWHVPMLVFRVLGFFAIAVVALTVRPWFSETQRAANARTDSTGSPTILNRNTVLLTVMSLITCGLSMIYTLSRNVSNLSQREASLLAYSCRHHHGLKRIGNAGFRSRRVARRSVITSIVNDHSISLYRRPWIFSFSWTGSV